MSALVESFFLERRAGPLGQRFMLCHRPASGAVRGAVVHVHAFAEEMNKARRMVAQQAHRLAEAGYVVLQIDLLGCGDSAGDFGDAGWDDWIDDVLAACQHARAMAPGVPLCLWGLRAGCLLASEAVQQLQQRGDHDLQLLLWQPVPNGAQVLQQFLRLKAAAELLGGGAKGVVDGLRAELAAGRAVDIAGYLLNPALADGLQKAALRPPAAGTAVAWLEVSPQADASWTPASKMAQQNWQRAGCTLTASLVQGPPFWQTTEIEDAPALWQATLAALAAFTAPVATAADQPPAVAGAGSLAA